MRSTELQPDSIDARDLTALHDDGADVGDAVALWHVLENPKEMLRAAGRWEDDR